MSTLYRKYRPKLWSEVVDQNHVKMTLENELETGTIAHAYLFSGPRGLGKTTVARLLAKSLNCQKRKKGTSEPCNTCVSCTAILQGNALDVLEIDAASHTGVDNVREHIIAASRVHPTFSSYKVFIVDEVHMLSLSAFNALLKTLEEPPAHVVLILATTEIHKLPETIISRCQRFDFRKIPVPSIVERLRFVAREEGVSVADPVLLTIARLSEGSLRDGEGLLGQILALGEKKITMEEASLVLPRSDIDAVLTFLEATMAKNIGAALLHLNAIIAEGMDVDLFLRDVLDVLRGLLLRSFGPELGEYTTLFDPEHEKRLQHLRKTYTVPAFLLVLNTLFEAVRFSTEAPQLALELALASLSLPEKAEQQLGSPVQTANQKGIETKKQNSSQETSSVIHPSSVDLSTVQSKHEEITKKLKTKNHSLALLWNVGELLSVSEETIEVGFVYPFHRERLEDPKNKKIIESVLQESFGKTFRLVVTRLASPASKETLAETEKKSGGLLNELVQSFGGRIVETS